MAELTETKAIPITHLNFQNFSKLGNMRKLVSMWERNDSNINWEVNCFR